MRRAILFDLDGTLLDPRGSIRTALDAAVTWGGFAPLAEDAVLIGMPLREILRLRSRDPDVVEAMVEHFREVYTRDAWQKARWVPGALDVVREVARRGAATAVVTTKGEEETRVLLERLGVTSLFDAVVGDDDVRPTKPDPAPVLAACERLDVPPGAALMVGDTVYDVEAARAAGAPSVGVLWGHGHGPSLRAAGADAVVADVPALEAVLSAWLDGQSPWPRPPSSS